MIRATQPVSINGVEFDALIDSQESYTAEAPTYPTENNASVTDTVVIQPFELSMTLFLTETPVTWRNRHGTGVNRVNTACNNLLKLFRTKAMVGVSTSEKNYSNMIITSLTISKSTDVGYAREIPITLKEVTIVSTKTTEIDPSFALAGKTENTGSAGTSSGNSYGGGTGKEPFGSSSRGKSNGPVSFLDQLLFSEEYEKSTVKPNANASAKKESVRRKITIP